MTAAQAAAAILAERLEPGSRVLVVGGAGLVTAVREAGLQVVDSADASPVAVVQGYAPDVGWRQMAEAAYAIEAGAWFVASNLDRTLPTERGFAPGTGRWSQPCRWPPGSTRSAPASRNPPSTGSPRTSRREPADRR